MRTVLEATVSLTLGVVLAVLAATAIIHTSGALLPWTPNLHTIQGTAQAPTSDRK